MNRLNELSKALNTRRRPSLRLLNSPERRTEGQYVRLRMAFPMLTVLLPSVGKAAASGRAWTTVLDARLKSLDDTGLGDLELEILDLDAFASQDDELKILLCSVLRLGRDTGPYATELGRRGRSRVT